MWLELPRYVVEAVVVEGRSYREVARAHEVSKSWVAKLVVRFREGGYEAIKPRSKTAHRIPHKIAAELEDRKYVAEPHKHTFAPFLTLPRTKRGPPKNVCNRHLRTGKSPNHGSVNRFDRNCDGGRAGIPRR